MREHWSVHLFRFCVCAFMLLATHGSWEQNKRINALEARVEALQREQDNRGPILQTAVTQTNLTTRVRNLEYQAKGQLPSVGKSYAQWEGMEK